jgi:hypothetical protein
MALPAKSGADFEVPFYFKIPIRGSRIDRRRERPGEAAMPRPRPSPKTSGWKAITAQTGRQVNFGSSLLEDFEIMLRGLVDGFHSSVF